MILADFPNIYLHGAGSKISLNSLTFTMSIIGVHMMSFSHATKKNEKIFSKRVPLRCMLLLCDLDDIYHMEGLLGLVYIYDINGLLGFV